MARCAGDLDPSWSVRPIRAMQMLLALAMAVAAMAADDTYQVVFAEKPADKAQVRLDIEKLFRDAGAVVKSITIREAQGPRFDLRYVVVVAGAVVPRTLEATFNAQRTPRATITLVGDRP
jgi:hypothetical protein